MTLTQVCAKVRVESVSWLFDWPGATVAIRDVLQLFVRLSASNFVSAQSLNGINWLYLESALMHFPRQLRLWFIFFASSRRMPLEQVRAALSDPARSTSVRIDWSCDYSSWVLSVRITCERDDCAFICVAATARWRTASVISLRTCCGDCTGTTVIFCA